MSDHKIEGVVCNRDAVHRREGQMKAARAFNLPSAQGGGAEHGPRQIDAEYVPALRRERNGVPASAATQVEEARSRRA